MEDLKSLTPDEFNSIPVDEPVVSEPEKTGEESTPAKPDESKVVKEEERVPYSRLEEVITKSNEKIDILQKTINDLQNKKEERPLSTQEQETLEAKTYLRNMLKEVISESEAEKAKEEDKKAEERKTEILSLEKIYKDFDSDKVSKYANKHTISNLEV